MKIKTIYSRSAFGREESAIKHAIWGAFDLFASPCRRLIEVVIRKDFGERYFRLSGAVGAFLFLALLPAIGPLVCIVFPPLRAAIPARINYVAFVGWYLYLALFLLLGIRHHIAQRHAPSVYDFERYSLDSGTIHPVFHAIEIMGKKADVRTIECWLEPLPFFLAGALLALTGQALGWLLLFSAVTYAVSYRSAYNWGDNDILDRIDEMIVNKSYAAAFLDDSDTFGFRLRGRKPTDPAKRQLLLDDITQDAQGDEEEDDATLAH